ncbi:MAG: PD-(D/E)XK nuclease family transposase, partial [Lachnospiraceae bacterium]|nr:PD-(D/E)XK nuclease family transposase [Lachnospiraceae bacterium]
MSNRKKLQDLTIRDNFMFAAVMTQEENCKRLLEMVLNIEIERLEISYEKSFIYNPEYHGIRLDVYAKGEDNTRYDVEIQIAREYLGKRVRYYHSQMDMDLLLSGH